jgi:hypothetical protein
MHVHLDIHRLLLRGRYHRLAIERLWSHFRDVSPSTAVDVGFAQSNKIAALRSQHVSAGTTSVFPNSMQAHSAVQCLTFCCQLRDEFCCTWYVCLTTSSYSVDIRTSEPIVGPSRVIKIGRFATAALRGPGGGHEEMK